MTEITLRPAVAADEDAIRACIVAAYASAAANIPGLPDVASGVGQDIQEHRVLVAKQGSALVGVVVFGRVDNVIMVFNLAVAPCAQGHGVARRLLSEAENEAKRTGCSVLRLTTHRLMQDTRSMYAHLGWRETGCHGDKVHFQKRV